MKIAFFEVKNWEIDYLKANLTDFELFFEASIINLENISRFKDFEIISVFTDSKIDKNLLDNFTNLKLIATRTTGTDHIDINNAKAKGISVENVPTYGENTVAEFTFALLLSLSRKIPLAISRVKEKGNFTSEGLQGFDLAGKTLGVVGTGNIGKHVIKIANGFGMRVVAYDLYPNRILEKQLNFAYVNFDQVLEQSDIISLHIPYLPTTHHLINSGNIQKIKPGAVLVNTARGAIVETEAIVKALKEGLLSAVGLDVLEEETNLKNMKELILERELDDEDLRTIIANHVLIDNENVMITPHNAYNTKEALTRILDTTIKNILKYK